MRDGIVLAFHGAFAVAAESLLSSKEFVHIAMGGNPVEVTPVAGPTRHFTAKLLSNRNIEKKIGDILSAVVTVRLGLGHGSGFVISEDGLILTNYHVVGDAKNVGIILSNDVETSGVVLARNEGRDVALIKMDLRVPSYLPVRMDRPERLDKVYVIGTPIREGLKSTVTAGVVSSIKTEERSGLGFIQADAAISPGNSGGPLLDEYGNAVGISARSYVGRGVEGLHLFIPIDEALQALNLKPKPEES
jgi:S1-C subfamily serine protease